MRKILVLVGLLLSTIANAASLNVSWSNPSSNVDGSAIPASGPGSLTGTRVEYGSCNGSAFGVASGQQIVLAPASNASFPNIGPGSYCVRAFAQNTFGSESAASNVASKIVPAPVPNPPVLVVATVAGVDQPAVFLLTASNTRSSTVAGFADVGTECLGPELFRYRTVGYRRVDPANVHWWKTTPTQNAAAPCA